MNAAAPSLARAEAPVDVKPRIERYPLAVFFDRCPRCENAHKTLELKTLTNAPEGFTHFAMCPELGEPILLKVAGA